jgi:integrase/recombinase XerD
VDSVSEPERDLGSIRLPRWGRVVAADGIVPWVVIDPAADPVAPIREFLRDFVAQGNRPTSVRSYAYDLLRWWRWLQVVEVDWDKVTSAEVRDYVLWLGQTMKPRNSFRTSSVLTAGTVNPITRKQYLDDRYQARTVRHSNAVLRGFYDFWIDLGGGPLINPVRRHRTKERRPHEHHNPLDPYRVEGRILYNPKIAKRRPRDMPDERWDELFAALGSNRDRAILALTISNGARASEVLGVRGVDLDWGEQVVRVTRKGSGAQQWLPVSAEAFVWIRLYLDDLGQFDAIQPLWWTLRRRDHGQGLRRQPMNYEALRAVFRRVNSALGTNWSMHDLRHTCSLRMARDETLSLRDVQTILGHAHLSTTADIYMVEDEAVVIRRVAQHLVDRQQRILRPPAPVADGYDASDLSVLFGGSIQ